MFGAITLAFNQFRGSRQLWLSDSRTFGMFQGQTSVFAGRIHGLTLDDAEGDLGLAV
ncbi:hypothetical protein [Thiocapsa sp.]|uniref:hypothetical protein n=1 Tax=Thiocapsa sp. TaxID=2024551 RepID=UPI001BD12EB6|nr:hypothetical protein [Thiocapsa sp.]